MIRVLFLAIVGLLILLYKDSFISRFFQDDFLLLKLAQSENFFAPIANFPYRPVSINLFYSLGHSLFGPNVIGFHLLNFAFLVGALIFIFLLVKEILQDEKQALFAVFLYAFNISLFPLFYWVATSYFTLVAFFVFGGLYFYFRKNHILSFLFFILALLSNELAVVFPALLFLLSSYLKKVNLRLLLFFFITDIFKN